MSINASSHVHPIPAGGPAGSPSAGEPARPRAGPADARAALAERQRELVDALTSRTGAPASFDRARVHLTRRMLARKRCHGVEKSWPALIQALGERWIETFAEYATAHPIPPGGGPFEDGLAFARHLRRTGTLPAGALPVLLLAEVWRGLPLRAGVSSAPRRLVLAVRAAGWSRVLIVPLDFSRTFRSAPR